MTTKDYLKASKQLNEKPIILKKYLKHNKPKVRTAGIGKRSCVRCGRKGAHIQQYGLGFCRQCFRETAKKLEFKKYS